MRMDLELLQGACDIHIHSSPDVFARLYDHIDVARQARDAGMRAVLMKCHHQGTADRMPLVARFVNGIDVFGSLNLNYPVGGLNPWAVETAIRYGAKKIFMPTVDARHHVEITGEVGGYRGIAMADGKKPSPLYENYKPISVLDNDGSILPEVQTILELIAEANIILSCGHLSAEEIRPLVRLAKEKGIRKIVADHPFWSKLPFQIHEELAAEGVWLNYTFMEISPRWWTLSVSDLAGAIRTIGAERIVMSSDVGQLHNPPPVEALRLFIEIMLEEGIPPADISKMIKTNPGMLLYD